ncbi:RDD family protein [Litchfieldia salsa]|uniref:Uncharacterized membrane protein YckC, RDD family n=1 Tax=Litchfieldia salsa TaxID=930152 RepID=A0A1H0P4S9_9BACI|nr:RDD family protein [Litchfieldia salsa]SDO99964.1 Uncharacterized membrane protein YckC, RDD family [Litchfieldia salsa]
MDIQYDSTEQKSQDLVPSHNNVLYVQYAGFWMRFWAYLLDLIVIASLNRIIIYPILRLLDIPIGDPNMFAPVSILTAITYFLYFVLMTKYFKQTLGKMIFGLKVISLSNKELTWSTVIFREFIGRFISKITYIGYLIVAFLPKKQGIHDLFSETTVVHEHKELIKQS